MKVSASRESLLAPLQSVMGVVERRQTMPVIRVGREHFRRLIEKTHFAMAQQDVRYYLNGTMLEATGTMLRAVATDGHRLSLAETELAASMDGHNQVIVPRKGILELQRI